MTAKLLDGKSLAEKIKQDMIKAIKKCKRPPGLAVILVGEDPASEIYVRNKRLACEAVGIRSHFHPLPLATQETNLVSLIEQLNADPQIDGILLQLPLPPHIDCNRLLETIHPLKDVDGFHPYNLGRLAQRRPLLRPCTPYGIITLLQSIGENFEGRHAVIIGASNIVGRPMALEMLHAGSTITVCHRLTEDIKLHVSHADILISAVGKPNLIKGEWIKPNAIVVDAGITRLSDGSLVGDIEFQSAQSRATWITPVPGGVGPMTVATLLKNTLLSYELRQKPFMEIPNPIEK